MRNSSMRNLLFAGLCFAAQATTLTWSPLADSTAVCNDGSPAGYYWRAGANNSSAWIVFLEGGAWCYDQQTCLDRSNFAFDLTSSINYAPSIVRAGIFSSSDPRFGNANMVYVKYCSSDGHGEGASCEHGVFAPLIRHYYSWGCARPLLYGGAVFCRGFQRRLHCAVRDCGPRSSTRAVKRRLRHLVHRSVGWRSRGNVQLRCSWSAGVYFFVRDARGLTRTLV